MDSRFTTANRDRMLRELTEFLSIQSISALPAHAEDCRRAANMIDVAVSQRQEPKVANTGLPKHRRDHAIADVEG